MSDLWPHQARTIDRIDAAIGAGYRRIAVAIPTGGGKTRVKQVLARLWLDMLKRVSLYTNRTMLREQLSNVFMDAGVYHGIRAAGEDDERDHPFQISSIQTEYQRVVKKQRWQLHKADLVLVDEAHLQKEEMAQEILRRHADLGAIIVGFSATPLDLGDVYDTLITGATNSELRACGALVPAIQYAPDEPDLKAFKKKRASYAEPDNETDDDGISVASVNQAMGPKPQLFGRIWENFETLNPRHLPTLCFAPDLSGSLWIAEQFVKKGLGWAHIDGDTVWINGKLYRSDRAARADVVAASKAGDVVGICTRFVLREGIDCPWLRHAIYATVFSSVQTLLQSGGRILRADNDPETIARFGPKDHCTVQDHGGNWWRYGSLNDDREWFLTQSQDQAAQMRSERIRRGLKEQPFRCPKCGRTWTRGRVCQQAFGGCGYELGIGQKLSRPVVTAEGSLREMTGEVFRPRRINQAPDAIKKWSNLILYRCRAGTKGSRTFRQAAAAYAADNNWAWPAWWWPLTPIDERDWWLKVEDVPRERLRPFTSSGQPVGSLEGGY